MSVQDVCVVLWCGVIAGVGRCRDQRASRDEDSLQFLLGETADIPELLPPQRPARRHSNDDDDNINLVIAL